MSAQGSDRPDLPTSSFRDASSAYPDGSHISLAGARTARVDPPILEEKSEEEEEEKKHSPTYTNLLHEPGVFCAQRASAQDRAATARAAGDVAQREVPRARSSTRLGKAAVKKEKGVVLVLYLLVRLRVK